MKVPISININVIPGIYSDILTYYISLDPLVIYNNEELEAMSITQTIINKFNKVIILTVFKKVIQIIMSR
jgi:hypothetical protein